MPAVTVQGLTTLGKKKANEYRIAQRAIVCAIMVGIARKIARASLYELFSQDIAQRMAQYHYLGYKQRAKGRAYRCGRSTMVGTTPTVSTTEYPREHY
jgi:hypothetical protein